MGSRVHELCNWGRHGRCGNAATEATAGPSGASGTWFYFRWDQGMEGPGKKGAWKAHLARRGARSIQCDASAVGQRRPTFRRLRRARDGDIIGRERRICHEETSRCWMFRCPWLHKLEIVIKNVLSE